MIRVVVIDGHPAMRLGLTELLNKAGIRVAGEAGDGEEALRLAREERPDLIVLGLNLTGELDGIEACRRIKALPCPPRVLVHTAYNFTDDVASCVLAGADGYLHKRACCERFIEAVGRTAAGERVWCLGGTVGEPRSGLHAAPDGARLTPKEREVLVLMLRHYSNTDIARALFLSLPTVKTHVRSILRKLGLKSRKELFRPLALAAFDP